MDMVWSLTSSGGMGIKMTYCRAREGIPTIISHGLVIAQTRQQIALTAGSATANPYQVLIMDATNIYVTAASDQPWYWGTVGT